MGRLPALCPTSFSPMRCASIQDRPSTRFCNVVQETILETKARGGRRPSVGGPRLSLSLAGRASGGHSGCVDEGLLIRPEVVVARENLSPGLEDVLCLRQRKRRNFRPGVQLARSSGCGGGGGLQRRWLRCRAAVGGGRVVVAVSAAEAAQASEAARLRRCTGFKTSPLLEAGQAFGGYWPWIGGCAGYVGWSGYSINCAEDCCILGRLPLLLTWPTHRNAIGNP